MAAYEQPRRGEPDSDVLIVGAGPVGLSCALLLAQRGWRVTVLERWPTPYPRPRAVHFDDEVARLLAQTGIRDQMQALTEPADIYEWRNADGATLLRFDWSGPGPSGWPTANMMHQPRLEAELAAAAGKSGHATILRGHEAVQLSDHGDHVEVVAHGPTLKQRSFTASWVIGCDGANSFVRTHMPTQMTDLGFFFDWLIVDVIQNQRRTWDPTNLQICDPVRPTTVVSGGPGRRRWEFMRMPGETIEDLNTEATAWQLLQPWHLDPANSTLERHAVYTFQAQWADLWRSGRLLLAGDAAHLMPPFAGQGMCSGIRDAANLSWKLDLVLRGLAGQSLLDTYGMERRAHVQHAIGMSVELGKVICVSDPDAAAQRDAFMISKGGDPAQILPPLPPPMLTCGLLHRDADGNPVPPAGALSPQPRVGYRDRTGLLDDVVGTGFLLAATSDPRDALDRDQRAFLDDIGAHVLRLVPAGTEAASDHDAIDIDNTYLPQLAAAGHAGVLIRPDYYLFGAAHDMTELAALVSGLHRQLAAVPTVATAQPGLAAPAGASPAPGAVEGRT